MMRTDSYFIASAKPGRPKLEKAHKMASLFNLAKRDAGSVSFLYFIFIFIFILFVRFLALDKSLFWNLIWKNIGINQCQSLLFFIKTIFYFKKNI